MKKSLSLFVASSMVVSMFAGAAYAADEKTPGEFLNELGVIQGNGTDLKEDQKWQRQDVVVLLSRLLGEEEEAADAEKTHEFTDVTDAFYDSFISWAVEEGLVEGKGNGKFGFKAELKNQEFFAIVLRAFGVETTGEGYAEVPALAVEYGFATEETDMSAVPTRGETYATIVAALNTEVPGTGQTLGEKLGLIKVEAPAAEAKAAGAKKIEVKFNKPVDDTKATFTVKKGTINLNVASKSFNEDKTVATLELSSKLSEGDYTVTVGGVQEEALTSTFKAENEKVAKIEFLSTNAPLVDGADVDTVKDDLSIPYQVLNQYGENITKSTSVTQNIGTVNQANGTIDIDGAYQINHVVAVTLVHPETATSAVGTFTVVAEARIAEVTVTGLYNADNKTIDEATNLATTPFYLLVEAKDQYGNAVSAPAKADADLIINETNNTVVDANSTFTTVEVNGVNKLALRLNNPGAAAAAAVGQSTITLISNTTGKNSSATVVVTETTRADVINLINPGTIYMDEDAYIPVEVLDKDGNAITSLSTLNSATKGVKVTYNGNTVVNAFVLKDNAIQIKVPASAVDSKGIKPVIAMTATNKVQTMNVTVADAAVPTVIRGLDADFGKARLVGAAGITIGHTNLAIEDQYGRVMSDSAVAAWLAGDADRAIQVTDTTSTVLAVNAGVIKAPATVANFDADVKGNEKLTFTLVGDAGTALPGSVGETTVYVTDGSEYVSYSVDAVGTVYDEVASNALNTDDVAYDKAVKVYGVLASGAKVLLSNNTDYTVHALSNAAVNTDLADGTLDVDAALTSYGDKSEFVVPVTVTIGKTGQEFTQDVTFSKAAPKVASVKFVAAGAAVTADAKTALDVNATPGTLAIADLFDGTTFDVVATDQYGVSVKANNTTAAVTFPGADADITLVTFNVTPVTGSITIANNGTAAATVSGIGEYEEFDVKITYTGGATATVRVRGI